MIYDQGVVDNIYDVCFWSGRPLWSESDWAAYKHCQLWGGLVSEVIDYIGTICGSLTFEVFDYIGTICDSLTFEVFDYKGTICGSLTFDIFDLWRLEDGDVLSPYDDLSFLMYTDSEVI